MAPKRILIIGGPASGKSTLALRLARELGLPSIALDRYFWDDQVEHFGVRREPANRDRLLAAAVAENAWVMEGVYWNWTQAAFERAEHIVFLDRPAWLRHWRLVKRHFRRRLGIEGSSHKESLRGMITTAAWNQRWNRDNRPKVLERLERHRDKLVVLRYGELLQWDQNPR